MSIRQDRIKQNGGKISKKEWESLLEIAGYKCQKCGSPDKLSYDHILPVVLGGKTTKENGQVLCLSCNSSKWASHADYRNSIPSGLYGINKKMTKTDAEKVQAYIINKFNIGLSVNNIVRLSFLEMSRIIENDYYYACSADELFLVAGQKKQVAKKVVYPFPLWVMAVFKIKKIWQKIG